MEEEGTGGDICCVVDVQEFICQGVSVLAWVCQEVSGLATRSSCGDETGMTYLLLSLHVWPLVGADCGGVWV